MLGNGSTGLNLSALGFILFFCLNSPNTYYLTHHQTGYLIPQGKYELTGTAAEQIRNVQIEQLSQEAEE